MSKTKKRLQRLFLTGSAKSMLTYISNVIGEFFLRVKIEYRQTYWRFFQWNMRGSYDQLSQSLIWIDLSKIATCWIIETRNIYLQITSQEFLVFALLSRNQHKIKIGKPWNEHQWLILTESKNNSLSSTKPLDNETIASAKESSELKWN